MQKTLRAAFFVALTALPCIAAHAQQYPAKPVRFIIPFPPGGPTDLMGRMAAERLSKAWGVQVVPDNRAGAGGNIGTDLCAKSPPDGYTICILTVAQSISPAIYTKLPFDPLKDLTPVTLMATLPSLLTVHPALPVKTVKELVALAKSKPGELSYASTGNGTSPHMMMEYFKVLTGVNVVHIPYKGQAPAVIDQISGQVQLAFNTAITVLQHVHAKQLKAIAVSTKQRFPAMPELPTVDESGVKGFEGSSWNGIVVPVGTPKEVTARIYQELTTLLKAPETREKLLGQGAIAGGGTPEEFAAYMKSEIEKWTKVAKFAKVKLD
ncbi:MAG: Bug family tripartite tricarboxylate transporter substrate binding protein [Rhodospirillaceae bacterium]